jgi:hypothetical protein
VDDGTRGEVRAALQADVAALLEWVEQTADLDLATAEQRVRAGVLALGARLLTAGLAARGTGKEGARRPCACGGDATFEGYRPKQVQTRLGWMTLRRAYYWCATCRQGQAPLDGALGVARDSPSPGVRRAVGRLGALVPFAQAAATWAEAAAVQAAPNTVRAVTEAVGARREQGVGAAVAAAWHEGLPPAAGPAPARLYVARDGVRILGCGGEGQEAKIGVIAPEHRAPSGDLTRDAPSYAAGFVPAADFGRRLALEARRRGLDDAAEGVVLGDGAEWTWNLAAERCPAATQIVDWYHASQRVWALGRALYGEGPAQAEAWVEGHLGRLAKGAVRDLGRGWRKRRCRGPAAAVRDEQGGCFTNQASRMAYDRCRARGLDIGSGMVESACKLLIGARAKGPGMRWSTPGANPVAQLRVLLFNEQWPTYNLAA